MATAELNTYLSQAEQALASGDRPAAAILINQILLRDFVNDAAWHILQRLLGNDQAPEVFQSEFAQKYYPDQIHLLTTTPGQVDEPPQAPVVDVQAVNVIPEPIPEAPDAQALPQPDTQPAEQLISQPDPEPDEAQAPPLSEAPPVKAQPKPRALFNFASLGAWLPKVAASFQRRIAKNTKKNKPKPDSAPAPTTENPPPELPQDPGAAQPPAEPALPGSVPAEKIADLVEQLGWQTDAAAQHCSEYLIEIGPPAVNPLISALQAGSIFTGKRKEKELRCQRAAQTLIGIGRPAVKVLITIALDTAHVATAAEANQTLVRIGVEALDLLIERLKIEPSGSANWHILDGILSEILDAPSLNQLEAMRSKEIWTRIALSAGALIGGLLGLIPGDPLWVLAGIFIGGYLLWALAWGRWQDWSPWELIIAPLVNIATAPVMAWNGIANRKSAELLRANRVEKFTQPRLPGPQAAGKRNIERTFSRDGIR